MLEVLLVIESLPSTVCFSCCLNLNLHAFSLVTGLPTLTLTLRFLTEEINFNLTLQLRIIFFTFAHICSLHPLNRQRLFMLCLVFFWGILSLIHFKKQATTGWLEAVVGTSWGRGDGALAAGAKASQSFRGRQIELSTQTYAVNARVNI